MGYYDDFYYYPPSKPIKTAGGIRAVTRRGSFGAHWWSKQWIDVLDDYDVSSRLSRGRTYARKGQVLSIKMDTGKVRAKVQGSRITPYTVTIEVAPFDDEDREIVASVVRDKILYGAKLLNGELPVELDVELADRKINLFPDPDSELENDCSCPDWSNPCKHIAAVYYLMAEQFDLDPFLLFKLRGIEKQELMAMAGVEGAVRKGKKGKKTISKEIRDFTPDPIKTDVKKFWLGTPDAPVLSGKADKNGKMGVGNKKDALKNNPRNPIPSDFPFWKGETPFRRFLMPIYKSTTQNVLKLLAELD